MRSAPANAREEAAETPLYQMENSLASLQRLPPLSTYVASRFADEQTTQVDHESKPHPITVTTDAVELRRERNRMHQARYKRKQSNKLTSLESSVDALKKEIQELTLQRQVISAGVRTNYTRWAVAAEYFRLFRNGITGVPTMPNSEVVIPVESNVQRKFLEATMALDVVGTGGYGVDGLLRIWKLTSLCHPDIDIQLVRLEDGPADSLIATTRGTHTITEGTLRFAFPHLTDGSEENTWLASRLLGQRLVMTSSSRIMWNTETQRVVSIQYSADMLTPMLQLLGNLEDVSKVFTNARLNAESRFVAS
ncbi:bZIP transcription factor 1 [Phytophthora citrophthora]|uniref:BZIP transcription factor 1 n=1 Tax=Phytophthora citrophthora TaxID=4793 RepID=A0AAD9LQ34_9STRA|nr:bZIP transcription factor 1 [Phytophthora citrophthora]